MYVYVLQSDLDKKFYTGITQDLMKRVEEHNSGISRATKTRVPLKLIYFEFCLHHKDAMKREKYLTLTWGKRYIKNRIANYLQETKQCT